MSLRDTLERIRSNPAPGNEETAKFQVLAPILADLSWDPFGQEVRWEHPVGGKKSKGWVDIALKAGDHIWALVEAKAPGANLNHHVEQVLGYAFFEGVSICVLTDGLCWWLYLPREPGPPEKRRFAELELAKDSLDQVCDDLEAFLGRESLVSGRAETRATQVLRARTAAAELAKKMPPIWRRMLDEPDDELVELVGQRVYEEFSLRPEREQILAVIREVPIPTPKPAMPVPADRPQATKTRTAPGTRKPTSRPSAIVLWSKQHPVRTHKDVLMTVVNELHERHDDDFYKVAAPPRLGKRHWVASDRGLLAQRDIRQTTSGCYVAVHMGAVQIKGRAIKLLEAFGYGESDLEYVYE